MENLDLILKYVTMFGLLVVALIPAIIAKTKHRSFIKFYLFGIVLIIPAIIVAIIISDPEDDAVVRGKGVWFVVAVISFYFIIKKLTKVIDYYLVSYVESTGIINNDSKLLAVTILALLFDVLLTLVLSIIVADIISRPLIAILFTYFTKLREYDDTGRAIKLFKGVILSMIFYHEREKEIVGKQRQEYEDNVRAGKYVAPKRFIFRD